MPVHEMSDGMQIFYDEVGEGTPLIFTSSGNATHAMWVNRLQLSLQIFAPSPMIGAVQAGQNAPARVTRRRKQLKISRPSSVR